MGFFKSAGLVMGISFIKMRCPLKSLLAKRKEEPQKKVFNDPVHGHIELHPLCVKIVNTPQFQRLRFIKQLGGAYFVYPGAAHNRFEHSIGVSHLARNFARALQKRQPELRITEKDILCVEIAGLCHDLGHGPYSHLFDDMVMPAIRKEKWEHEDGSVKMFDYMVEENGLETFFEDEGIGEKDITFIKEQIKGIDKGRDYEGRLEHEDKQFLYQIVSNKTSGIDVDKWDYFSRDCLMLGMKNNFDHSRAIAFSRVLNVDKKNSDGKPGKQKHIVYRDKEAGNFYELFHVRYLIHRRACHHRVTKVVEIMIADAIIAAVKADSEEVKFRNKNGQMLSLAEAVDDMSAYSQVTDDILLKIYNSVDPKLRDAKRIAERIFTRKLYHYIDNKQFKGELFQSKDDVLKDMENKVKDSKIWDDKIKEDIAIHLAKFNYGKGKDNPIDQVWFYNKRNPNKAFHLKSTDVSYILPENFSEQQIFVYCRSQDETAIQNVKKVFDMWCSKSANDN